MHSNADAIALALAQEPLSSRGLQDKLSLSQATISRAITALGDDVVRIGTGRSISYALRDASWHSPIPVYRVDAEGKLQELGALVPVRPDGFVMQQGNGKTLHSDGLPWWLADMRPQGFLGRAFAQRYAETLSLPKSISDWTDRHALKALVARGHDTVGNVLLGESARQTFLTSEFPTPVAMSDRPDTYARLAAEASEGELPTSSAGGEQPKFTAFVETADGPHHVIVKFSQRERNAVTARWRDLLFAEHLALLAVRESGVSAAAATEVIDSGNQRFLQVKRFDRVGALGRRALHSLGSLDDEFVGDRQAPWPVAVKRLIRAKVVEPQAEHATSFLYAYGLLIGNTDMHMGNLSFMGEHGRPYQLAPAYDMLPMGFAPTPSGSLKQELKALDLPAVVPQRVWHQAMQTAQRFLETLRDAIGQGLISDEFQPCAEAIDQHLSQAQRQIDRMSV